MEQQAQDARDLLEKRLKEEDTQRALLALKGHSSIFYTRIRHPSSDPTVTSSNNPYAIASAFGTDKTWCVAKPSTIELALKDNIQFACNNINCSPIQIGGVCFYPDTTISHASVVMNIYYQANGRNYWNCDFGGSGMISFGDPSYGNCKYD
ncbi:major pollen allergen Ole e 10-like [Elaeis guineensis]|uniref:major pollen allergen Ole e 10-like n=1 Tax=Elaeis guineensis var. tenera TaxID=51953 RepID=UPI003C6CE1A4